MVTLVFFRVPGRYAMGAFTFIAQPLFLLPFTLIPLRLCANCGSKVCREFEPVSGEHFHGGVRFWVSEFPWFFQPAPAPLPVAE